MRFCGMCQVLQIASADLKDLVETSITLSRAIDQLTLQVSNRDVIEQAAIAGMLNAENLFKEGAADYLVKRLDLMADVLEQGWQAQTEQFADQPRLVLSRTLRGITETHYLDRKFINTAEARRLDAAAGQLQEVFAKRPSFVTTQTETVLKGPSDLAAYVTALGRKGRTDSPV